MRLYAFTAEGDPHQGVIIGDDSVMVIGAQATPHLPRKFIAAIRTVPDKPNSHLMLTHCPAVRVPDAAACGAPQVIMMACARAMVAERGAEDWASEFCRFRRPVQGHEEIAGLTWPTTTFGDPMTVYPGKQQVRIMHLGRAQTAGDAVVGVPDAGVMFTGDIVEYHPACDCGDGHFADWVGTLDRIAANRAQAIAPGRGDALTGPDMVAMAITATEDFTARTFDAAGRVAAGGETFEQAWGAVRAACDPHFTGHAIHVHVLPLNDARVFDKAEGIDTPLSGTAACHTAIWAESQG